MLETKRKQLTMAIGGLDCASRRRLHHYSCHLATDRDPKVFDDRMKDYLLTIVRDRDEFTQTIKYLDSMGYNQSKYEFSKILEQLDRFTDPNHTYFGWNQNFKRAKEAMLKEVSKWRCRPVQYDSYNIAGFIPKLSTHAGFSFIETGLRKKECYVDGMYQAYVSNEKQALISGTFGKPILIGARTQASGAFDHEGKPTNTWKAKTRLVSMIDIYQIMAERKFQYPLQDHLSVASWYAGGKNDLMIKGTLYGHAKIRNYWTSIDYSSFDQSLSDWLIHEAFDIVEAAFDYMSEEERQLFRVIREDFIHKMFVAEGGRMVFSDKGVPSGSMFTQIIDSICNRLMVETYLYSLNRNDDWRMMIMGDDNIIFTRFELDLGELASYLNRNFGVNMNPDKSEKGFRTYPVFLSRTWAPDVWREEHLLISKLCYPEHFREYDKMDEHPHTIIMQYYDNFPAGLLSLVDEQKLLEQIHVRGSSSGRGERFLTGLERYRAMFDRRSLV